MTRDDHLIVLRRMRHELDRRIELIERGETVTDFADLCEHITRYAGALQQMPIAQPEVSHA